MNKKPLLVSAFVLVLATVAYAAGYDQINSGWLKIGNGSTASKQLEFNVGNTTDDPIVSGNSTNDLLMSVNSVRLLERPTNGANYIALGWPASLSGDTTLTLPSSTDTLVGKATTDTLTNKTLTSPTLNGALISSGNVGSTGVGFNGSIGGVTTVVASASAGTTTMTLPAATDTFVGKATTDVLTNKTLTGNTAVNLISGSGTLTLNTTGTITVPNGTDTLVGKATTDTLTSKTLTSPTLTTPALTGNWTATGNLTHTSANSIANLINATGTGVSNVLTLRTGNGTTSSSNAYTEYDTAQTAGQTWDVGLVGNSNFTVYNQTAGSERLSLSTTGNLQLAGSAIHSTSGAAGIFWITNGSTASTCSTLCSNAASANGFTASQSRCIAEFQGGVSTACDAAATASRRCLCSGEN